MRHSIHGMLYLHPRKTPAVLQVVQCHMSLISAVQQVSQKISSTGLRVCDPPATVTSPLEYLLLSSTAC